MSRWFILFHVHGVAVAITCKCNWEFGASLSIERGCDRPVYSWGTCHPWRWTNTRLAPTRSGECDQCRGHLNRVFAGDISLSSGKDWNYDDPSCWATKFPLCGEGQRQSPIQIHRLGVNCCEADVNQEIIIKLSSSPFTTSIATTVTRSRSHIKTVGKDLGSWFHLLGCRKQVKPHHTEQKAMPGASSQDSKRTSGLLVMSCLLSGQLLSCV